MQNETTPPAPPGVIIKGLGKVSLAKDFFTVKIDVSEMKEFSNSLKEAKVALQTFLDKTKTSKLIKNQTLAVLRMEVEKIN